jgi:hypothetical protein
MPGATYRLKFQTKMRRTNREDARRSNGLPLMTKDQKMRRTNPQMSKEDDEEEKFVSL